LKTTSLDIVIFGAGIAGLWTLARLRQAGYRVALFERDAIGGVQSIASQGIIHGGTKYALTGKLTGSAMAIGEMPGIWRAALAGDGELDLRDVRVLSPHQYLWTTGSLASGMAGFFAGKVMQSRMQPLDRSAFPPPFDAEGFHGQVYQLDEPVIDPASLARVLAAQLGDACFRLAGPPRLQRDDDRWSIGLGDAARVSARTLVFTAGSGNAGLLAAAGRTAPAMQRRPLHMLMVRGGLPPLYAHCLGPSANPRLTVTSACGDDGGMVWYLGGQVAEEGVARGVEEQIEAGRRELARLLPWVTFGRLEWSTLRIDRAEPAMPGGRRPDDAFVEARDAVITCWPTKLAFAPRVARLVAEAVARSGLRPGGAEPVHLDLPAPPLARLPWDQVTTWS
jgi:glycine/D-amino acid oxidase-like deaminating enzyme